MSSSKRRKKESMRADYDFASGQRGKYAAAARAAGADRVRADALAGDDAPPFRVRARVRNGRLVVDEPTTLPEGTVLDLVPDDGGDDLDATERAARDAALLRGLDEARKGKGRPATEVLARLRRRR